MEKNIGIVTKTTTTQAYIKIMDTSGKLVAEPIKAWNSVSAKIGDKVVVEEQQFNSKKLLLTCITIPLMSAYAGFLFGGNLAGYVHQDANTGKLIGAAVWLFLSLFYIIPFRRNVIKKGNKLVVTEVLSQ